MPTSNHTLRSMRPDEFDLVSDLICNSTNVWYLKNRGFEVFAAGPRSCRLFPETYEALDPGCCVVAPDPASNRLMGSCFYHPRPTHVSLGIMNVHPDFFGRGVASRLLKYIIDFADAQNKPVRLVSSSMNLDSFSLYSRAGFAPIANFADMQLNVPAAGFAIKPPGHDRVRAATLTDLPAIVALEEELTGIQREKDHRFFIENKQGIWNALIHTDTAGQIDAFLCSVIHPASTMIGPGFMRTDEAALALIAAQINHNKGHSPVLLIPLSKPNIVKQMYAWGAKNIELHFAQVRGNFKPITGVIMPTFMPETA